MHPPAHFLFRTPSIRLIEREALTALPAHTLMRRAARAAADLVAQRWPEGEIAVLCGPGNNGGDGLMLAALLHQAGRRVRVWALPNATRPPDAAQAWRELPAGLLRSRDPGQVYADGEPPALIVDALFGIGLSRPLPETAARWADWARLSRAPVLALDVPSGLDADTGAAQADSIVATHTLTYIGDKPGLHTRGGGDHAGTVSIADLGLAERLAHHTHEAGRLIQASDCPALFMPRGNDTHKGSYGTLGLIGGAPGMTGAALLAARAALYTGAGKILVGLAESGPPSLPCDPWYPELMLRPANDLLAQADNLGVTCWIAGCGMGTGSASHAWLAQLLAQTPGDRPLVLDADALTLLAGDPALATELASRHTCAILTPHPREAARLLGTATDAVQADRIVAAQTLAARYRAWVILKGAGTVVSAPTGQWSINGSGNAGLATAGTGDVLAGMVGALLAQGLAVDDAARAGVWLHGAAADALAAQGTGPIGLTAGEIAPAARALRNQRRDAQGGRRASA